MGARVRNLRTGSVSFQYHVIFDDLFQTVLTSGENDIVFNTICNQLFESNLDFYDENEFMIYSPPPLDEDYLSEPEHWDRKEKMQA